MDIEKLLSQVSENDAVRLKILNNAVVKNMRSYNSAPTEANKRNWDASDKALAECVAVLSLPSDIAGGSADDLFSSKLDVWRFLNADGWTVSRSQFYAHCNDRLLRPDKSGQFTLSAVIKYAKQNLKEAATGRKISDNLDRMHEEKMGLELKQAKVKLEKDQHDLDTRKGRYVSRDEFELAIVSRAVAFMAHLNHAIQANTPDWIDLVNGDQLRAAELVHSISEVVAQRMSDFAADAEFDVIFEAN